MAVVSELLAQGDKQYFGNSGRKRCPLCNMGISSNIETRYYCQLCGMGGDGTKGTFLKKHTKKFYFCCKHCLQEYVQFMEGGQQSWENFRN